VEDIRSNDGGTTGDSLIWGNDGGQPDLRGFPRLQISENWSLCSLAGERAYCIAVRPFLTDIGWTEELTTILPSTLRLFGVVVTSSVFFNIKSLLNYPNYSERDNPMTNRLQIRDV
jgi:hypothetical protein